MKSPRCLLCFLGLLLVAVPAFATDLNVAGNITATGTIDTDGATQSFGSLPSPNTAYPGILLTYTNDSLPAGTVDSLKSLVNRSPASWLWLKNTGTATSPTYANVMRLDGNNQLVLFQANGTTAGVTLTPVSNQISLGTATLSGSGSTLSTGTGIGLNVTGAFTASNGIANTTGAFTSPTALSLSAGGTNQNITLTPSGTGYTILNGKVGIRTAPSTFLHLLGDTSANGVRPVLFESPATDTGLSLKNTTTAGRMYSLFSSGTGSGLGAGSFFIADDTAGTARLAITSAGNVGIGTTSPSQKLSVSDSLAITNTAGIQYLLMGNQDSGGVNKPSVIRAANAQMYFGTGSSWTGTGGTFTSSMLVDSNGNIGIGTTSPSVRLDVTTAATGDVEVARFINPSIGIGNYGYINVGGADAQFSGAFLGFQKTGASSGNVALGVRGSGGTININELGNVGIGTITPGARLDVVGDGSNAAVILARSRQTNAYMDLITGTADDAVGEFAFERVGANAGNIYVGGNASGNIVFRSAGYTYKMMINSVGNVGIGTAAPASKLNLQDAQPELSMGLNADPTTYNRFGFNTSYQGYWSQNATWNGAQWNHVVGGGYNGAAVKLQEYYGSFQIDTADAGVTTDPIAWNTRFYVANNGNIGIGTVTPSHKLAVKGTIRANEVIVDTGWADYVFDANYRLAPLAEVEQHIKTEKHLPGIPSAQEIAEHGVSMGDMQSKLLSKIEEITLHQIAQEKQQIEQANEILSLKTQNLLLQRQLAELKAGSTNP